MRTAKKTMAVLSTIMLAVMLTPGGASAGLDDDKTPVSADGSQSIDEAIEQPVPGRFASWRDFFEVQERLDEIGTKIVLSSGDGTGYAGIVVDVDQNVLNLYWKGELTPEVREIVAGAPVRVHQAPYTEADLVAQAQRAAELDGVTQAGPQAEGSGLILKVSERAPRATLEKLRETVSVPYELSFKEPSRDLASKGNDIAPYWGGARIRWQPTGASCSTSFAIKPVGVPAKMLTAGHCRPWADIFNNFLDGGGDVMGTSSSQAIFRDTLLIDTKSAAGRMYTGNFDSDVSRPVKDAFLSFKGDSVCRSSSFSNQMCSLKVVATHQNITSCGSNGCWPMSPMTEVEQRSDLSAAGNGDSGGAVFSFRSVDSGVNARGMVSASAGDEVPCTGVPTGGNRSCTTGMFYSDIVYTIIFYSASMVTG